jgi:GNAT superfamily N-acetyltransferase
MLTFHPLSATSEADVAALNQLLQQAPGYALTVQGRLPTLADAREALQAVPPGKGRADKLFGGYMLQGRLVGCADLIRGHPEPHIAFLGLLLLAETHQRQGLGPQALVHLHTVARGWGCTQLRLAVIDQNVAALHFWQREGFAELYRKPTTGFTGDAVMMRRAL